MGVSTLTPAQQIAREAMGNNDRDVRDVLSQFDRDIIGPDSVMLRLPLRDPVEVRRHLAMIEDVAHRLRMQLEERRPDRSLLFMVRGEWRKLHQKLNAYRTPRRD